MPDKNLKKLLSGYATDTLTEKERKALFEAALDDQALFDALADEQELRELLDDPASRRLLLEALEEGELPVRRAWLAPIREWFERPLGWAVAGGLAVAVFAVVLALRVSGPLPPKPYLTADSRTAPQTARESAPAPIPQKRGLPEKRVESSPPTAAVSEMPAAAAKPERSAAAPAPPAARPEPRLAPTTTTPPIEVAEKPSSPELLRAPPEEEAQPSGMRAPGGPRYRTGEARELFYAQAGRLGTNVQEAAKGPVGEALRLGKKTLADRPKEEAEESRSFAREPFKGIAPVAPKETASPPVGLRYSVLQRRADGSEVEADPSEVFEAGAPLQLSVEVTQPGFLYVMQRDPATGWTVLFPAVAPGREPRKEPPKARVTGRTRYVLPLADPLPAGQPTPLTEVFLLYSREVLPGFDDVLSSLEPGEGRDAARGPSIDAFINHARRRVAGRALLREKVGDAHGAAGQERAVYVVDAAPDPKSLVLVELTVVRR